MYAPLSSNVFWIYGALQIKIIIVIIINPSPLHHPLHPCQHLEWDFVKSLSHVTAYTCHMASTTEVASAGKSHLSPGLSPSPSLAWGGDDRAVCQPH